MSSLPPIEELLPTMGIELTDSLRTMIDVARGFVDDEAKILAVVLGLVGFESLRKGFTRALVAVESIAKELKNIGVEAELHREAIPHVIEALNNLAVEVGGHRQ